MMEKAAGGVEAFYIYVTSRYIRDLLRWNKKPGRSREADITFS